MFIVVAEELHFGRAAARLNMTQPPLSQRIRELESRLGAPLFVRSTRSVQLTPAGKVLLERSRRLITESKRTEQAVRHAASGSTGVLNLGFVNSAAYAILPKLLAKFRAEYADIAIDLTEMTSSELIEAVASGRVDIALLRASASMARPDLEISAIMSEPLVLALPKHHALAQREAVALSQLDGQALIGFNPIGGTYFKDAIKALFAANNIQPKIVYESLLRSILALVEAEIGLAIVPASASYMRTNQLVYRPLLAQQAIPKVSLHCVRRANEFSPIVAHFWLTAHAIGQSVSRADESD